jgi:hypothetical protein
MTIFLEIIGYAAIAGLVLVAGAVVYLMVVRDMED